MGFKPKILVVDDEPLMLDLLAEALTQVGAEFRCVLSSQQAAGITDTEKFDGVFLDWMMPELDGLELARKIRWSKSNSLCPIVMVTGNTEPGAMGECFRAGINFFLQKPVSLEQIQKVAKNSWDLMLQERLRYQRVPAQVPVVCVYAIQSFEQHAQGQSIDMSTTGMLVKLGSTPSPGSLVRLEFTLPGNPKPCLLTAFVVRHASSQQVGLRFVNLTREERWQLLQFSKAAIG